MQTSYAEKAKPKPDQMERGGNPCLPVARLAKTQLGDKW